MVHGDAANTPRRCCRETRSPLDRCDHGEEPWGTMLLTVLIILLDATGCLICCDSLPTCISDMEKEGRQGAGEQQ